MEYSITSFVNRLRDLMYVQFPYLPDRGRNYNESYKHGTHNGQIRDIAFKSNPVLYTQDSATFDIGNEHAEQFYPYYHILEDAPVIRKRNKGTKKTKGSQAEIKELGKRDYGRVEWNGKTFTKEYSRNVRGSRKRLDTVSHWGTDYKGNQYMINREANSYQNIHYHYIENMLNSNILDRLAQDFNMKRSRTVDTGLNDELMLQNVGDDEGYTNIVEMMSSHNIGELGEGE